MAADAPARRPLPTFWQRNLSQEASVLALLILLFAASSAWALAQLRNRYIAVAAAEAEKVELRLNEELQQADQQLRLFARLVDARKRHPLAELLSDFSDLYAVNHALQVTEVIEQLPTSQVFPQFSFSRSPLASSLRMHRSRGGFSPLLRGVEDGRPSLYIAVPQRDGLLLGRLNLESLRRFLRQFSNGAQVPVLLVARNGSVLLSSHDGLRIPAFELDDRWNQQVVRSPLRIGDQNWIPIITPARSIGAAIVTLVPTRPLEEDQRLILMLLLVASSGSSVLIALKNLRMRRLFIQPIANLAQRMHSLKTAEAVTVEPKAAPAFAELAALESAFQAMAQAIRAREEDLRHRASTDELTGLLNRRELLRLLELLLIDAGRDQALHGLALLFCDLDLFKDINDNFGHAAGDLVLRCVGRRIRAHIRDADLAARVGGDEIVVVLKDISDPADALAVAQAIRAAIAQPIRANGIEAVITASIGVTWANDQEDVDSLMARADLAMYRAKQDGRNRVVPFA